MQESILVLDDDPQVRGSLAIHLEDDDYLVYAAESGEEALVFIKDTPVALAVVDLRLPGMDGVRFIEQAMGVRPELKIIIYTGSQEFSLPDHLVSARNVSNSVILKPLTDLGVMSAEIERMLQL